MTVWKNRFPTQPQGDWMRRGGVVEGTLANRARNVVFGFS